MPHRKRDQLPKRKRAWLTRHLREIGSKGGQATGEVKSRGDTEHYKKLAQLASEARRAKAEAKTNSNPDEPQ